MARDSRGLGKNDDLVPDATKATRQGVASGVYPDSVRPEVAGN